MIYLDSFRLPSHAEEDRIINIQSHMSNMGYTDNAYPCNIFIRMKLSELDFKEITVLYGSNGSGKSTLLNLIAEKLKLKRVSPFNRSNIFDRYTKSCDFRMSYDENGKFMHIPAESRIISSDDVFDYMLNVRENNTDIFCLLIKFFIFIKSYYKIQFQSNKTNQSKKVFRKTECPKKSD